MDRRAAWTWGVGVLFAALLVVTASSGAVAVVRHAPDLPWEHATFHAPPTTEAVPEVDPLLDDAQRPGDGMSFVVSALVVAILAVGLIGLARTLPARWRGRVWAAWERPAIDGELDDPDAPGVAVDAVVADADQQRELLVQGEARNAIVACWLRLEAAVTSAGVVHHRSDTSTELTERVLAGASVDPTAIRTLAALYREARFSSHALGEEQRAQAIAALDAVHAGLRRHVPA